MSTFVHVWCWTCDREIARSPSAQGAITNLVGAISKHRMDHGGIHDISIMRQEETDGDTTTEE